jgi:hypothetical protein
MIAEKRHEPGSSMVIRGPFRDSDAIMHQQNKAQWLTITL